MVTHNHRGRAQLILVGALLLATVILGLSMLLNSMLLTGATGDTGATAAIEETDFVDYDVEMSMRELVVRLNHEERNRTPEELGAVVATETDHFSRALAEARARSGSVAIAVEYNNSSSSFGRRIVQAENAGISDSGGSRDWDLIDGGGRVGWFSLSVNTTASQDGDTLVVEAVNQSSGDDVSVTLDVNGTGVDVTPGGGNTEYCEGERGRVLIDVYAGRGFTDDCGFTGIGSLDWPDTLNLDANDEFVGKYAVVVSESTTQVESVTDSCGPGVDPDPCRAPAIWEANVTTSVQSNPVSYQNTANLTVYTNDR